MNFLDKEMQEDFDNIPCDIKIKAYKKEIKRLNTNLEYIESVNGDIRAEQRDEIQKLKAENVCLRRIVLDFESEKSKEKATFERLNDIWGDDKDNVYANQVCDTNNKITRVEIIDNNGRAYVNNKCCKVRLSFQDNGKTLKIFLVNTNENGK